MKSIFKNVFYTHHKLVTLKMLKKQQDECDRLTAVAGPCTEAPRHVVGCHLSPPIAGERVGVEVEMGTLEAYSTKPTCKPQSTMCSY